MILAGGIFFSVKLGFIQFAKLPASLRAMFGESGDAGDLSPFRSACVALAATIGTGNIVGVAAAISLGGAGAVFWMWTATLLCLPVRYAEGYLGYKSRRRQKSGMLSGAFLYIEKAKNRFVSSLAPVYAFLCLACTLLGMGTMVQSRSVTDAVLDLLPDSVAPYSLYISAAIGAALCVIIYSCISRGVTAIGGVVAVLVPVMLLVYCAFGLFVIFSNASCLPAAISDIFSGAFTGNAALGGFAGATAAEAVRRGISKGVFTNEAGLGTAAFAAGASSNGAVRAGLAQMAVAFVDTIVVCSVSAFAILCTGAHTGGAEIAGMAGAAFDAASPIGGKVVSVSLLLFSFTSALGLYFYGKQCLRYLTGGYGTRLFNLLYCAFIFAGCIYPLGAIWNIADIFNGLLVFINIPALLYLWKSVKKKES